VRHRCRLPPSVPAGGDPAGLLDRAAPVCPTRAIDPEGIEQGRCIRCARCAGAGVRFEGSGETVAATPGGLRWPGGREPAGPTAPSALSSLGRSLHVFLMDVGSCQACNLEVLALSNPLYDLSRLGIAFTNSPRHADVLVVVGIPTMALVEPLRRTYDALPAPKAVLAVGACALDGGIFRGNPGTADPVRSIVPVDLFVPGCPPPPLAILHGLLTLAGRQRRKEGSGR